MNSRYDWHQIERDREEGGFSWGAIAASYGVAAPTIRGAYSRWKSRQEGGSGGDAPAEVSDRRGTPADGTSEVSGMLTAEEAGRIRTLEDLLAHFNVDLERWEVSNLGVNCWEQAPGKPVFQVKTALKPKSSVTENVLHRTFEKLIEDAKVHAPQTYWPAMPPPNLREGDPVLFELAVCDPHIGMYAWGKEVGAPYDTEIGIRDYSAAVEHLLGLTRNYNVERILYVVGNDIFHVDTLMQMPRGGSRGGATTAGTLQDVDTRLPRIFTKVRRAVVEGIDKARLMAPVDVLCVPGNHDEQSVYRLGEVLNAWYRNDNRVNVIYGPQKRFYYTYGKNLLGFTHGTEFKRKRDNLSLIMATEAPKQWAETTHREIHVGHNHIAQELKYMEPATILSEGRAIRVRSLPGLTPEDGWHYGEGYKHQRSATALAFYRDGGLAGLHEIPNLN